ncbi:MAG: putative membrane protein [Lentimonas sp.]|jgi:uncharacterized membrane protein
MAGIGFSITKSLARGTLRDTFLAYGFAALMGSGPWMISILSLAFLSLATGGYAQQTTIQLFFVSITYAFSFSLVSTGAVQLLLSRCASDQIYAGERSRVGRLFVGGLLLSSALSLCAGIVLFGFSYPGDWLSRISAIALFAILGAIWTSISFISAQKDYLLITIAFAIGYGLSYLFAYLGYQYLGAGFLMIGFTLGQLLLLLLLVFLFHREFGIDLEIDFSFLSKIRTYLPLVICGTTYNLGIWVDKFIYWFASPFKQHLGGTLYACPVYDVAVYLSFLSIIPGIAVFLLKIETHFAREMAEYVEAIQSKATLSMIEARSQRIINSVQDGFFAMVKIQGLVTLLLILSTDHLVSRLGIGALQTGIFQITLIGAFLCVIFFSLLTVLFYLDCMKEAAVCTIVLFVANSSLTGLNLYLGAHSYGTGYVIAVAIAIIPAFYYVNRTLGQLTYRILTKVPLGIE